MAGRPSDLGNSSRGAGDGNRTRTISLGICTIRASPWADLRGELSVSYRESPLFTEVNGPPMARCQGCDPSMLRWPTPRGCARQSALGQIRFAWGHIVD